VPQPLAQFATWEWVEREIVRQITSRAGGKRRADALRRLLAKAEPVSRQRSKPETFEEQAPWMKKSLKQPQTGLKTKRPGRKA
jgi:hypothetical protein